MQSEQGYLNQDKLALLFIREPSNARQQLDKHVPTV
jgi:hypothetical protein